MMRIRPRTALTTLVVALAMVVSACATNAERPDAGGSEEPAGAASDEDDANGGDGPHAGVELALLIHPTLYDAIGGQGGLVDEFEAETGASVEVVTAPIGEHLEKAMTEFASGTGRYDVLNMQGQDLHTDVTPFLADIGPAVTGDADYDWEDFPASLRDPATDADGKVSGIPFRIGVSMMYYRGDLFADAGLQAPQSLDDLREVTAALGAEHPDITPLVQRGIAEEITHDWLAYLHAAGGDLLTDDFSACVANSPEGVAAAQLWADLYDEGSLPPNLFEIGRDDYIASMREGRAAIGSYFSPYWGTIVEPGPDHADDMEWTLMPTADGVEPGTGWYQAWYLTVSDDSANPDAATELAMWLTNAQNQTRAALEWANGPVRESSYNDPEYQEAFPLAADWLTAVAASKPLPAVPSNTRIVDILSDELTEIVRGGKTAQQGLDDACARVDELL